MNSGKHTPALPVNRLIIDPLGMSLEFWDEIAGLGGDAIAVLEAVERVHEFHTLVVNWIAAV